MANGPYQNLVNVLDQIRNNKEYELAMMKHQLGRYSQFYLKGWKGKLTPVKGYAPFYHEGIHVDESKEAILRNLKELKKPYSETPLIDLMGSKDPRIRKEFKELFQINYLLNPLEEEVTSFLDDPKEENLFNLNITIELITKCADDYKEKISDLYHKIKKLDSDFIEPSVVDLDNRVWEEWIYNIK